MGKRGRTGEHLKGRTGNASNGFKRGWYITRGYKTILAPAHPMADSSGYVLEHRFVVSKDLGRSLRKNEIVHHRNGNKLDNRLENLEVQSRGEHLLEHYPVQYAPHWKNRVPEQLTCSGCEIIFKPRRTPRFQNTYCSRDCYIRSRFH